MNYEVEINKINARIDNLQQSFIQAQRNQVPITAKVDNTASDVKQITPYTETKTAYYGEKEKAFYNVPQGNVTVFFSNYDGDYSVNRISDRVTVAFDALAGQTDITISIQ